MGKKNEVRTAGIIILGIICLFMLIRGMTVNAEEDIVFLCVYTGTEQVFRVPYTGVYRFELYGAQGGNSENKKGGKGGQITATMQLNKGDELYIFVGGQDGYNGGGLGSANGGGATDIRLGGNKLNDRVLVAGGGGGANTVYVGGEGGIEAVKGGNVGSGEDTAEGSGGGGGYLGGHAGIEHIVSHVHQGDYVHGGDCYAPIYHVHSGDTVTGGGCYTVAVLHGEHTDSCYDHTPVLEGHWSYSGAIAESSVPGTKTAYIIVCDLCGATKTSSVTGDSDKHCVQGGERTELICGYTPSTIVSYRLGCGKTTDTIEGYYLSCTSLYDEYHASRSSGGTNWYDEDICGAVASRAGVREGDGMCRIELLSMDNCYFPGVESLNAYYKGTKARKVYYKGNLVYFE